MMNLNANDDDDEISNSAQLRLCFLDIEQSNYYLNPKF